MSDKIEAPAKKDEKKVEKKFYRAVFGLMIHPMDETRFTQDSIQAHEEDFWVKAQVEAGKLAVEAS